MEVNKKAPKNAIQQDENKDGSPRYYTYGTPFFNYGMIPQTWEDPAVYSDSGHAGDNDPLDVIELGSQQLAMGSITPCRVLGSLELIDEGETDHKIICIALSDPNARHIHSMSDLEHGVIDRLRDWLTRYKTSDGKPENNLAPDRDARAAVRVIEETHVRWRSLCDGYDNKYGFWLSSPGCRG